MDGWHCYAYKLALTTVISRVCLHTYSFNRFLYCENFFRLIVYIDPAIVGCVHLDGQIWCV